MRLWVPTNKIPTIVWVLLFENWGLFSKIVQWWCLIPHRSDQLQGCMGRHGPTGLSFDDKGALRTEFEK